MKVRTAAPPTTGPTRMATAPPTGPATLPREDVEREIEQDVEREGRSRPRALDPYKVLLHNDDHNSMDHVVRALTKSVPGIGLRKAFRIMLEAHNSGKAIVIVCPLEPAELYRDRLQTFGLTATVEPA